MKSREPLELRVLKWGAIAAFGLAAVLIIATAAKAATLELVGEVDCTATATGEIETYDGPDGLIRINVSSELDCDEGDVIDPPPLDGPCQVLPVGLTRDASVSYTLGNDFNERTGVTYEDIFGPWPLAEEAQSRSYRIEISSSRYLSIPFTVPATGGAKDRVIFTWEEGLAPSEGTVVSVSTCEGGVIESQALPGCWVAGQRSGGGISIGVDAATAECVVERGKAYWLNVADYDQAAGESTCDRARCEWLVRPIAVGAVQ